MRSHRLTVRTTAFQAVNRGSIPRGTTLPLTLLQIGAMLVWQNIIVKKNRRASQNNQFCTLTS